MPSLFCVYFAANKLKLVYLLTTFSILQISGAHWCSVELAGRKSTSQAKRLADASFTVSAVGILVGIILFTSVLTGTDWVVDNKWKSTDLGPANATFCHVVDNDTTCFRFASSFTVEQCSAVAGVIVNISSSTPAPSPAATLTSTLCYHNDCEEDSFIVDTSCFHHRSAILSLCNAELSIHELTSERKYC